MRLSDLTNYHYRSIAGAQLLNLPITILGLIVIGVTGVFADNGRLPRPVYPLTFLIIILACYSVMVVYPNTAGVYAATMIGNAVTAACKLSQSHQSEHSRKPAASGGRMRRYCW